MEERIRASIHQYIVSTWLSGDERGFDDNTDLLAAGILDSFSTLSITAHLEETFHVQLAPAEINPENLRTVNTLARIVATKLAGKDGSPTPA
jgi:acyl carrier protein